MQAGTKQTSSNSSANTIQLQAAKLLLFQLRASCEQTADYTRLYGRFLICVQAKRIEMKSAH